MTDYNFLEDLLDTYQSMDPFMQFAWLVVPFTYCAVFLIVFLHHLRHRRGAKRPPPSAEHSQMLNDDWQADIFEDANHMLIERRKERLRE